VTSSQPPVTSAGDDTPLRVGDGRRAQANDREEQDMQAQRFRRGTLAMAATVAAAGASAGAAQAASTVCVPDTAGLPVTSGGAAGTCAAGTAVSLPASADDQRTLISVLPYLSFTASGVGGKPTIIVKGANLQLQNGRGSTTEVNGAGNLVLGYDERPGQQTGSHSLIIGTDHTFTDAGEVLTGRGHKVSAPFGVALGGYADIVTGHSGVAIGGWYNTAGEFATAVGGRSNKATGYFDAAVGGESNTAKGSGSVTVGGRDNTAAAHWGTTAGGCANVAGTDALASYDGCPADNASSFSVGDASSVFGGKFNRAAATLASVAGGDHNSVTGRLATLAGGRSRTTSTTGATATGNVFFVKYSATGQQLAINQTPEYSAGAGYYALVKWPNVNPDRCTVHVTALAADSSGVTTTWSNYYGYIYARAWRVTASGTLMQASVPMDITATCD
jgi:hypothetical protein